MNALVVHVLDMFDMLVALFAQMLDLLGVQTNVFGQIPSHFVEAGMNCLALLFSRGVREHFFFRAGGWRADPSTKK